MRLSLVPLVFGIVAVASHGQEIAGFGPLDPTPPAGMTPQQIIEKFAARRR
jgi:hypothetical protein